MQASQAGSTLFSSPQPSDETLIATVGTAPSHELFCHRKQTDQLLLLQEDSVVTSGQKTLQDLGVSPRSIEAMVPEYLSSYRPGGRFEIEVKSSKD